MVGAPNVPQVVGIAGGSASGKSTLGQALAARLGHRACLIEQDAYYRDQTHMTMAERLRTNYDHPDALEHGLLITHLEALAAGKEVDLPRYDFACHTRAREPVRLAPRDIVIVAGLHVLSVPEVRARLDLSVYVEAAPDVRLARRIRRDVTERGRDLAGVLDQWLTTVRPMHAAFVEPSKHHADMIVDGEGEINMLVAQVQTALAPLA